MGAFNTLSFFTGFSYYANLLRFTFCSACMQAKGINKLKPAYVRRYLHVAARCCQLGLIKMKPDNFIALEYLILESV